MSRVPARHTELALVVALLVGCLLGCGDDSPEKLLSSAKSYLAGGEKRAAVIQLKNALQKNPNLPEARYLLGKILLDADDAPGAEVEFRKALELKYPDIEVIPALAEALLLEGKGQRVIEDYGFGTVNLAEPNAAAALKTTLAAAYLDRGNRDRAEAALQDALSAVADFGPALLQQARLKASDRDVDGATALLDRAIAKDAANYEALQLKGDLLLAKGDATSALELQRKALVLRPDWLPSHASILEILLSRGDLEGAKTQLDALAKLQPRHPQTIYFRARLAAQKGELGSAEDLTQQLLKVAPENVQALRLAGVVALRRNQLLVAQERLGKLVQAAPDLPISRQLLARAYLRGGEPAKAIDTIGPLLRAPSPDAQTLSIAAGASLVSGDLKQATELYGRAAKLDPADTHSRTGLALARTVGGDAAGLSDLQAAAGDDRGSDSDMTLISVYMSRHDYAGALKAIDQLEKKSPGRPQAPQLRAQALALRGDLTGARASYEKALAADPNFYPAIDGLAALDLREKKPEVARARFEAVLKTNPNEVRAIVALAKLDDRAGKPKQEVAAALAKAIAIKATDPLLRQRLVRYHLGKHDFKLALNAAQDAVGALPNDLDILALLAVSQLAAGETNQALNSYSKLASLQPKSPMPLLGLAEAQIVAKSYAEAAESVKKAATLAPSSPAVVQAGARIDLLSGRPEDALAKARALQGRLPKAAYGFALEGDVEFSRRNWSAATGAYRGALQREPGMTTLAQRLYRALRASGDQAKADAFAAEWVKKNPTDAGFQFSLASLSIADGKFELAESQLREVLRLDPDNALVVNNLAWVLSAQKKPQALEAAERANRIAPNQPLFMDTLAKVLAEHGQLPRALQLQKKAVELDPNAYELRLRLARLYIKSGDKAAARTELNRLAGLGDKIPQQGEVRELLAQL
jgi:putative PEP-CTERM system TPR-repeat lipoprotein